MFLARDWEKIRLRLHYPWSSRELSDREMIAWGVSLELALLAFWALSGVWRGSWHLIAAFMIPGALFSLIAWRLLSSQPGLTTRKGRAILLGFAALYHFTLLLTPYPLSNDLYGYYWDGKLLANGVNPYTYPPAAVELTRYRDQYWELIFNRDVPTGYPPLAEAVFAATYRLAPDPRAMRGIAVLASLGTAALLLQALHASGRDERRVLLYAWSPLVALEFANSGHLDALALLCMSAALLLALKGHQLGSAIGLALGGLVKFFPALLLPVWGRRWSKTAWLAFAMVFTLPWLPLLAGGTPFNGLGTFARRVDFNSSLYRLIESAWNLLLNSPYARLWSLATVFVVLILIYVGFLAFRHSDRDIFSGWRFMGTLFGLGLLLSPVVHPWYVCWLLVFIAIDGQPAWLVLSVTVIFARHVYIGYEQSGVWQEAWWPSLAVWIPFYLAIAVSMWSSQKSSRKFAARHPSTGT